MAIKTSPNQKIVKVLKEKCDKNHYYAMINIDAMLDAMKVLCADAHTSAPFALWCYLAKN